MNKTVLRYFYFLLGVVINSFGVALITKGALGTSPISSVPYVLSLKFSSLSFGMTTFIINMGFIALQVLLLKKEFQPVQFLQIAVNLLFSVFIDISMALLGFFQPEPIWLRLITLVAGCWVLALGICIEVAPDILFVPGEGAVHAIARVSKKKFGSVKICFDVTLFVTAGVLSFVFFGGLNGLGIGTIISALVVGKFVNILNGHLSFLGAIRGLAAQ